jgi:hypothetical protein
MRIKQVAMAAVLMASNGFVSVAADELHFSLGGGPQVGSDASQGGDSQVNHTLGIDYSFYRHDRSPRSSFIVGVSYTYMGADSTEFDRVHAVSIYPQLSLYPSPESWVHSLVPGDGAPYFYVRALGPSYISANRLGDRKQAKHFAFQAQLGIGASYRLKNDRQILISISWKHFSNANLFSENDGIDLPVVLNFGLSF